MTFTGCGGLSAIGNEMRHLTPEMPKLGNLESHCKLVLSHAVAFLFLLNFSAQLLRCPSKSEFKSHAAHRTNAGIQATMSPRAETSCGGRQCEAQDATLSS